MENASEHLESELRDPDTRLRLRGGLVRERVCQELRGQRNLAFCRVELREKNLRGSGIVVQLRCGARGAETCRAGGGRG